MVKQSLKINNIKRRPWCSVFLRNPPVSLSSFFALEAMPDNVLPKYLNFLALVQHFPEKEVQVPVDDNLYIFAF